MNVAPFMLSEGVQSRPIELRKVAAQPAALQTALAHVTQPFSVTAGGAQILAGLDAPRAPQSDVPWLHFTLDGAPGAVQLPWGVARRLTGVSAEGAMEEDAAIVLEAALEKALDQVEGIGGFALRFVALRMGFKDLPVDTTLNLQGKDTGGSFVQMRQSMVLSNEAAQALVSVLEPRRAKRGDLPGLDLSVAWETDAITLSAAALRALEVGDAIEIDKGDQQGRVVLNGQQYAGATRDGTTVTLTTGFAPIFKDEENEMSEAAPVDTAPETNVDDIEVRLSFRAGQTSLPLKTLRGLAPGAVIEMTDPANAVVDIVANGRVVGAGELIDVAGRRAVQVRRLFTGT